MENEKTLNEIYTLLGSENCDKGTVHSYIPFYQVLFEGYRKNTVNVLEIGIYRGVSLLMWDKFFYNSNKVVGVDISLDWVHQRVFDYAKVNNKLQILQHDATRESVLDIVSDNYDIIIDDGSHILQDQLKAFDLFKDRLNDGGLYVIEDIQSDYDASVLRNKISGSWLVDLRGVKHRYDDYMLVYKK